jgi:signal transduction histidine kinase
MTGAFVLALAMLAGAGIFAIYSYRNLLDSTASVYHAHDILDVVHQIHEDILDAESTSRGYRLTQNEELLKDFHAEYKELEHDVKTLVDLVADIPSQTGRVHELQLRLRVRMEHLEESIKLTVGHALTLEQQNVRVQEGSKLRAEMEQRLEEIITVQNRLLAESTAHNARMAAFNQRLLLTLCTGSIIFSLATAWITWRELKRRYLAENNLRDANRHLLRVQENLRHAKDTAEAINKELESFSYSVSHDLRAPIRHIGSFAELLNQTNQARLDDDGRHYLGTISSAAGHMGKLIDGLLEFFRMGRIEMRRNQINTGELVAEVVREMAPSLAGRDIAWDIGPLPEVVGDRAMLKQVWANLLSNAVKYSRNRKSAAVAVHCRRSDPKLWEFSVQDNGTGFDMRYASKLFGVFQRLHHVDEFEGTGIGLANVYRIILRHGGRVWAEGKVDAGSTFYFTLPAV